MKKNKRISTIIICSLLTIVFSFACAFDSFAAKFGVSPMTEKISLTPGEVYYGSFNVNNPGTETEDFAFETTVEPFTNSGNTDSVTVDNDPKDYNQIVNWITILDGEGVVSPNESRTIHYVINVPNNAPSGGQYAAIIVSSTSGTPVEGAINIQQSVRIAYLIFADAAGETVHDGTIESVNVPGFLLSDNISGSALITNHGNIHADATYTLQVFPLFSNEEVYTNEEEPSTATIMPEASLLKTTAWDNTPGVGIFNVKYSVEFEGETTTVEKMVIKCPIWLLFIVIFIIIAVVIWLVMKAKNRKKAKE